MIKVNNFSPQYVCTQTWSLVFLNQFKSGTECFQSHHEQVWFLKKFFLNHRSYLGSSVAYVTPSAGARSFELYCINMVMPVTHTTSRFTVHSDVLNLTALVLNWSTEYSSYGFLGHCWYLYPRPNPLNPCATPFIKTTIDPRYCTVMTLSGLYNLGIYHHPPLFQTKIYSYRMYYSPLQQVSVKSQKTT